MDTQPEQPQGTAAPAMMSRTKAIVYLLAIALAAACIYYYFEIYVPQQGYQATYSFLSGGEFVGAQQSLAQGNYTQAVSSLQALEAKAPTNEAKAAVLSSLAISLYGNGDIANAASTYKQLASNPNRLPASYPALALDSLGFVTDLVEDNPTVVKTYIYNDPPYSGYLQQANGNIFEADIVLFKHADSLYPSAYSKYEIAYKESRMLYAEMHTASSTFSPSDLQSLAQDIQQNVSAGDALVSDPVLQYALGNAPAMWAQLYLFRAFALDQSNVVLKNFSDLQIDQGYTQALSSARQYSNNVQSQAMEGNIRFFYAASIERRGGSSRASLIKSMLSYFETTTVADQGGLSTANFIKYVAQDDPTVNPLTSEIAPLAAISPGFKSFLAAQGIQY